MRTVNSRLASPKVIGTSPPLSWSGAVSFIVTARTVRNACASMARVVHRCQESSGRPGARRGRRGPWRLGSSPRPSTGARPRGPGRRSRRVVGSSSGTRPAPRWCRCAARAGHGDRTRGLVRRPRARAQERPRSTSAAPWSRRRTTSAPTPRPGPGRLPCRRKAVRRRSPPRGCSRSPAHRTAPACGR